MFFIDCIDQDIQTKINSLLLDQLDWVKNDFLNEVMFSSTLNSSKIGAVLDYALEQNYGDGKLNKYYVTHPIRVATFMVKWMKRNNDYSTDAVIAALIHNAIEKQILSYQEIKDFYGEWCAHSISLLTQDRMAMKDPGFRDIYYKKIYSLDKFAQLIKFFDKLDNLYAICLNPDSEIRKNYILEIEQRVKRIGEDFFPEIIPYFNELITRMRLMSYHRI